MTPNETPLTDAQLSDIESLARKAAESGEPLKYLAPDAVVRLVTEVRALRSVHLSTRAAISQVSATLESEDAGARRAAIERIHEALNGAAHPAPEPLSVERAVDALVGLGWLPAEGREWAAGLMRTHLVNEGAGDA
jgi:hypothetical protein